LGKEKDDVEVFTCGDLSFIKKLRDSKHFTPKEIREIKRQILRSESYYIPKMKCVYLANVSINRAAEEAAHTVRHLCAGEAFPRPMQDSFYASVLHEAMAFFGSKIINPKRRCLRPSDSKKLMSYLKTNNHAKTERWLEYEIGKLFIEHENKIRSLKPFHTNKISALSTDLFSGLTHTIGYYLGEKMYHGLLQEILTKEAIRELFCDPMEEEGDPVKYYFDFVGSLRKVKLPRKI